MSVARVRDRVGGYGRDVATAWRWLSTSPPSVGFGSVGILAGGVLVLALLGAVPGAGDVRLILGIGLVVWVGARVLTGQPVSKLGQPAGDEVLIGLDAAAAATQYGGCCGCGDRVPDVVVLEPGGPEEDYCLPCARAEDMPDSVLFRQVTRGEVLFGWAYYAQVLPADANRPCGGWRALVPGGDWDPHLPGLRIAGCDSCRLHRATSPWWIAADALDLPSIEERVLAYEALIRTPVAVAASLEPTGA